MTVPGPAGPHDACCEGWHTVDISCADVARLRAEAAANPWYCQGATRSGYHLFDREYPDGADRCQYAGCTRTWAELWPMSTRPEREKPTHGNSFDP